MATFSYHNKILTTTVFLILLTLLSGSVYPIRSFTTSNGVYASVQEASTSSGCGDGICNGSETCSTCPADCGTCPPAGGGGGGGVANPVATTPTTPTTQAQVTNLDLMAASSSPSEVTSAGITAWAFARQAPTVSSLRAAFRGNSGLLPNVRGALQVSRDANNLYTINVTNTTSESDYDPTSGIGHQSIKLCYINAAGAFQAESDAQTKAVRFTFTGVMDYGLAKYDNASGTYIISLLPGSGGWLATTHYMFSMEEESNFTANGQTFAYRRHGALTISASDGESQSGEVVDTLSNSQSAMQARHLVQNSLCSTTYEGNGQSWQCSNSTRLLADRNMTFQWGATYSCTNSSGYLTYPLSGQAVTFWKCQNDRMNLLYPTTPRDENCVYARVFQHACSQDALVQGLATFILEQAQLGKISNPIGYAIDLVTLGIHYQTDTSLFFQSEYIALPLVGLYCGQGDCEDQAIFLGSLLHKMGADVVMVLLDGANGNGGHACIGWALPPELEANLPAGRLYWAYNSKRYYYLEPTGPNPLGVPSNTTDGTQLAAVIPPLSSQPTLTAMVQSILKAKR